MAVLDHTSNGKCFLSECRHIARWSRAVEIKAVTTPRVGHPLNFSRACEEPAACKHGMANAVDHGGGLFVNSRILFIAGLFLALVCVAMPGSLRADEHDQATKLTFNEPIEVPGQILAAGTYWFTLMDSSSDRNIVQIWNEDRSQLLGTIFTIADYRFQPAGKTVVNFEERPGDKPQAIQAGFSPG